MRDRVLERLATLPIVDVCSPGEQRTIAREADYVRVPVSMQLSSDSEGRNPVVIVLSGEIHVIGEDDVTTMGEGSIVGAAEILARRPRAYRVVTATDAELLLIEPRRFLSLLTSCPNLAVELMRTLARRSFAAPAGNSD